MHRAIDVRLTAVGLRDAALPAFDDVITVWDETQGLGSVWDAADTLAMAWLEHDRDDNVRAWLEAMAKLHGHPMTSNLGRGVHALIGARLDRISGEATSSAEKARAALGIFRRSATPAWIGKALELLQTTGAATAEETDERAAIDRSLGIVWAEGP